MATHVPRIKARLSLLAHRRVLGLLEGQYSSVQAGRGTDFNDLRQYVRGDEVKDLDWKASARTGELLVKRFVVLRRHTVVLATSTGRSMAAAHSLPDELPDGRARGKGDVAVEIAGLLGWLAVRQGDLVGAVYGDRAGQHVVPPRSGEPHLERCLGQTYDAITPDAAEADLVAVLRLVIRSVRRRAIILVVCDELEVTPELTATLRRLRAQHQVLVVTVGDIDPVAVSLAGPAARDIDANRGLPSWLRGDAALLAELEEDRTATGSRLHDALAGLGIVHEHIGEHTSVLTALRRVLARNADARR